jgi:hypothetical protein
MIPERRRPEREPGTVARLAEATPTGATGWRAAVPFDVLLGVLFLIDQAILAIAFSRLPASGGEARLNWDAQHYLHIAEHAYPSGGSPGVPPDGYAYYAFHPLFPWIVRALSGGTGWAPESVAPWTNVLFGTLAVIALSRWLRPRVGRAGAVAAVLILVAHPASAVFQMGYSEGLALLLLVLTWWSFDSRRYGPACLAVVGLALARPLAAPVLVTLAVVAAWNWYQERSWAAVRGPFAVLATGGLGLAAWPVSAGVLSGDPGVYWAAHTAFVTNGAASSPLDAGIRVPPFGLLLLLLFACAVLVSARLMPPRTPPLLRVWCVVYPVYLVVGAIFTPALIRYSLFMFPLGLVLTPVLRRRPAGPLVFALVWAAGLVAGFWWVDTFVPVGSGYTYP